VLWVIRRGTFSLYAGAFLTAASVPGIVAGFGQEIFEPNQGFRQVGKI
jgi:hypothetical protein